MVCARCRARAGADRRPTRWRRGSGGSGRSSSAWRSRRPPCWFSTTCTGPDEETLALLTALAADATPGRCWSSARTARPRSPAGAHRGAGPRRPQRTDPRLPRRPDRSRRSASWSGARPAANRSGRRGPAIHAAAPATRSSSASWPGSGRPRASAGLHAVPPGVRDVIRHRLAALTEPARDHLRQAAVLGHEVELDVLIALTGRRRRGAGLDRRPRCRRLPGRAGRRPAALRPRAGAGDALRRPRARPPGPLARRRRPS